LAKNTLTSTRLKAGEKVNSKKEYRLKARVNSAPCDCPDYEVFVFGEWRRTQFVGKESVLMAIQEYARDNPNTLKLIDIKGRFSGKEEAAPNGVIYESFLLTAFTDKSPSGEEKGSPSPSGRGDKQPH